MQESKKAESKDDIGDSLASLPAFDGTKSGNGQYNYNASGVSFLSQSTGMC